MNDLNRRGEDSDASWLVKVDSRILGPFTFDQVLEKVVSMEFKPFHECTAPQGRWKPLQVQPLFNAAIEKIKKHQVDMGEYTATKTERMALTRTMDITSATPTPMQSTPPPVDLLPSLPNNLQVESLRPEYKPTTNTPPLSPRSTPKKNSLLIASAGGVVVLLIFAFLFFPQKTVHKEAPSNNDGRSQFFSLIDHGLEYKKVANWAEAMKYFKKAQAMNSKDADLIFEIAPLSIQFENQVFMARSLLEKVVAGQYKKENVSLGHNLLGLSYSYENQNQKAIREYDEALKVEETYQPALINKAYTMIISERYSEAQALLVQALQQPLNVGINYVYLLEAYVFGGLKNKNKSELEQAFKTASQISNKMYDGQQEILFLQAYSAFKLSMDPAVVTQLLQKTFQVYPDQTADHLHSPIVDWRGLNWVALFPLCNEMLMSQKPELQFLMKFVCTYKMGNEGQAQHLIEMNLQKNPSNSMLQLTQGILQIHFKDFEKARLSLDLAARLGASGRLYYESMVQVCVNLKDVKCLQSIQERANAESSLAGTWARAAEEKLSGKNYKQTVYSGLRESSNYLPLLRMQ